MERALFILTMDDGCERRLTGKSDSVVFRVPTEPGADATRLTLSA